ncbi:hypothetical protein Taro_009646 [Colocasia esculenta]|uniref:Retrotransposon gag domain-containing protein n=1 Tax=Colocasia esculenta TaxID=4460 RepID=A0A843U5D2_COLES|nr:hypothetical protein [Colocasia esculenta]
MRQHHQRGHNTSLGTGKALAITTSPFHLWFSLFSPQSTWSTGESTRSTSTPFIANEGATTFVNHRRIPQSPGYGKRIVHSPFLTITVGQALLLRSQSASRVNPTYAQDTQEDPKFSKLLSRYSPEDIISMLSKHTVQVAASPSPPSPSPFHASSSRPTPRPVTPLRVPISPFPFSTQNPPTPLPASVLNPPFSYPPNVQPTPTAQSESISRSEMEDLIRKLLAESLSLSKPHSLQNYCKLPNAYFPPSFKAPKYRKYDGTSDPQCHLAGFTMDSHRWLYNRVHYPPLPETLEDVFFALMSCDAIRLPPQRESVNPRVDTSKYCPNHRAHGHELHNIFTFRDWVYDMNDQGRINWEDVKVAIAKSSAQGSGRRKGDAQVCRDLVATPRSVAESGRSRGNAGRSLHSEFFAKVVDAYRGYLYNWVPQAAVMADRRDWGGGGDDPEESTQRMIERIWESLTEIRMRMDQQAPVSPVIGEAVPVAPVPPPRGVEQAKREQFRTLQQGGTSVLEYQMRFMALSRWRAMVERLRDPLSESEQVKMVTANATPQFRHILAMNKLTTMEELYERARFIQIQFKDSPIMAMFEPKARTVKKSNDNPQVGAPTTEGIIHNEQVSAMGNPNSTLYRPNSNPWPQQP